MKEHGTQHGRPGVLLVNLGTPDAPQTPEVRRYLRQFLSDPRVLDINPIGRAALLNLIILPLRPRKSDHLKPYQRLRTSTDMQQEDARTY